MQQDHSVIVVGAGPVGLATAACLAEHGVLALVIDRNERAAEGSRAVCLSRRTLEILDQIGAAEPFLRKGLGWTHGSAYAGAHLIHRLSMPHSPDEKHWPMTNLQQYYMEGFLGAHCASRDVEIRRGVAFLELTQDEHGVSATLATENGPLKLRCEYLVAADGARSQVRRSMGLALEGGSHTGRYLIADIRMRSDAPTERRVWFNPPSNPGSTLIMHKQPDDIWRVDYQLHEDESDEQALDEQRVRARIQSHLEFIGEDSPWELVWISLYRAHCLALPCYRYDRVLFAGDAAHLVPIFGVRGLNSGIADAHNLAWKLARAVSGAAGPQLLDTYSDERRAATLEIFRQTAKSTRFMTPDTAGASIMRDAVIDLAVKNEFVRSLIDPRQSTPHEYDVSALNSWPERERDFAGGPRSGAPLKNMRVRSDCGEGFLLDWVKAGFVLLFFAEGELRAQEERLLDDIAGCDTLLSLLVVYGTTAAIEVPSSPRGWIALQDVHGGAKRLYDAAHGTAYLVRPDGHVCARWRHLAGHELRYALQVARTGTQPARHHTATAPTPDTPLECAYAKLASALNDEEKEQRAKYLARVLVLLLDQLRCSESSLTAIDAARSTNLS